MNILPMIIMSILAGFLSTMNVWANSRSHVRFHLNDVYMVALMTSWMVLFDSLYHNNSVFIAIGLVSALTFLYLIRNQVFINKSQFLNGMIPHHSMAILP